MYTLNQMRRTKYYLDFLQHNNSQHNLNDFNEEIL